MNRKKSFRWPVKVSTSTRNFLANQISKKKSQINNRKSLNRSKRGFSPRNSSMKPGLRFPGVRRTSGTVWVGRRSRQRRRKKRQTKNGWETWKRKFAKIKKRTESEEPQSSRRSFKLNERQKHRRPQNSLLKSQRKWKQLRSIIMRRTQIPWSPKTMNKASQMCQSPQAKTIEAKS